MAVETTDPFFIEAGGRRLRAQWIGADDPVRPVLVFLHEGLGGIGPWKGVPEALCEKANLRGLVYERWGFGGSERLSLPRPDDYLSAEAEQSLAEVLSACGIERPILVGHSDGATIALLHAAAYPDETKACVCLAAHVCVEELTLRGIRDVVARWEGGDLRPRLERYHGDNTEAMFRGWSETWLRPSFRDWNVEDALGNVACPVLLIQGERDEHTTLEHFEAIAKGVSGPTETYIVPHCGHSPHLEARDEVVAKMAAFIRSLVD